MKPTRALRGGLALAALLLVPAPTRAEDAANPDRVHIPADAGLLNVKDHGLRGDGATDDTAALLKLVRSSLDRHKTLFFPAGTYLLSDTIPWADATGVYRPWLTWQGEGRGRTALRLKDGAAGFGDRARPKSFIKTGCYDGQSRQNAAFNCYFFDLAIDTGSGNPGAVALDYCSNNNGGVVRVDIRSGDGAGVAGLSMRRDSPGPALVRHVSVRGFDAGITLGHLLFGMTFESVLLEGQREVGLAVEGNVAAVRRLVSRNRVPAVRLSGWASMVVLLDSELSGGAAEADAVELKDAPTLLLRGVTTAGYRRAVGGSDGGRPVEVPGGRVAESLHGRRFALFADAREGRTLGLPVEDAPDYFGGPGDWASVKAAGAAGDGKADDSAAVQRAMDSGKPVVYFPAGSYRLASPVVVRGGVRRVVGFSSSFADARGRTLFRFENAGPASFERFCFVDGGKLENAAAGPVVLRHVTGPEREGIVTTGEGRTWFFEDVCTSHVRLPKGAKLYARQFNCEPQPPGAGFVNDGGLAWVLGLKTEWGNTIGVTRGGGRTEVLGGLMLPAQGFKDPESPAFVVEDGEFSAAWNEITFGGATYRNVVRESRAGESRTLRPEGAGTQRSWSLYTTSGR